MILTPTALAEARDVVSDELAALGVWRRIRKADVIWCALPQYPPMAMGFFIHGKPDPISRALGYHAGHIYLPALSVPRDVRDVLRHEYGHALAYYHPGPIRSPRFRDSFGGPYEQEEPSDRQRRRDCISEYATERPMEDFAETFMHFVARKGRAPRCSPRLTRKWEFVAHLCEVIRGRGATAARRPSPAACGL